MIPSKIVCFACVLCQVLSFYLVQLFLPKVIAFSIAMIGEDCKLNDEDVACNGEYYCLVMANGHCALSLIYI